MICSFLWEGLSIHVISCHTSIIYTYIACYHNFTLRHIDMYMIAKTKYTQQDIVYIHIHTHLMEYVYIYNRIYHHIPHCKYSRFSLAVSTILERPPRRPTWLTASLKKSLKWWLGMSCGQLNRGATWRDWSVQLININICVIKLTIHPASRGVAAHTAGFFWSVTGAKGGMSIPRHPPCVCCFFSRTGVCLSQSVDSQCVMQQPKPTLARRHW